MIPSRTDYNVFLQIGGIVEKGLGTLFITSSSPHFFNETDFESHLFNSLKMPPCYLVLSLQT